MPTPVALILEGSGAAESSRRDQRKPVGVMIKAGGFLVGEPFLNDCFFFSFFFRSVPAALSSLQLGGQEGREWSCCVEQRGKVEVSRPRRAEGSGQGVTAAIIWRSS